MKINNNKMQNVQCKDGTTLKVFYEKTVCRKSHTVSYGTDLTSENPNFTLFKVIFGCTPV